VADPLDSDSDLSVDAETFQQWVSHTAESRGVDERELLNQLVSAFWVLDEMSDVAANVDEDGPPNGEEAWPKGSPTAEQDSDREDDPLSGTRSDDSDDRSAPEPAAAEPPSDSENGDADVSQEIDELRQSLRTEMDLLRTVTELRRQVADLSLDVEQQRSRQEEFTDRLSDDLTRLRHRVKNLDAGTDETDTELQSRVAELQRTVDDLDSTHDEFEAWVDEEFDEIEGLFNRLIDTTQQLDARLDDVEARVETVAESERTHADLSDLRREAQRSNVDSGRCESCDTTVDLSMLTEPVCPSCDETFTGVAAGSSWNPFSNPTLRTRSKSTDSVPPADLESPSRE
jgi:rubrerythrin